MASCLSLNNIFNPEDDLVILQFSPNLVPHRLMCSYAWMNRILVYQLCPRFVRPCPYTHKTCGMDGNTSILCSSSCGNIHQRQDDLAVLQFSPNLVPYLGYSDAWMDGIHLYCLCFRFVIPCPSCGMDGKTSTCCGSSCNKNLLKLEDGLVVLQFSPNLVPQIGYMKHG